MPKKTNFSKIHKTNKPAKLICKRVLRRAQNTCEILSPPVLPANDFKSYRTIRLPNQLTALLISDELPQDIRRECQRRNTEINEPKDESSSSESEASECSGSECEGHKTGKSRLAAASLTVSVGSFSDPSEVQGLAHFLEHMVFMGSKLFPSENDFEAFITKKGGSDNAHTGTEYTTFYFEIRESSLEEGLLKFAQFFINPLLKKEAMTRERKAVDSEFQMALSSDSNRLEQLLFSLAYEGHPARNFSWGNSITLDQNIEDDVLHKHLHKFRKRHYSSNRMTLAVQSRKKLDELQDMVVKIFSKIPNNHMMPVNFQKYNDRPAFDTLQFRRIYYVKPVEDIFQVNLTWSMPSLLKLHQFKPHSFISRIIGFEGPGSLIAYLRRRFWAVSIDTGNSEADSEHNSLYCLFSINIVLTEDGMNNLDDVFRAVFSYLAFLKQKGANEKLFYQMRTLDDLDFLWLEEKDPIENVEEISASMHYYPPIEYLRGPRYAFIFSADYIKAILGYLIPASVNIMVLDSRLNDDFYNQVEPWFSTKYFTKAIPDRWKSVWNHMLPYPEYRLPDFQKFLTREFNLVKVPEDRSKIPVKIFSNKVLDIWHKYDAIFRIPKAHICLYFITPCAQYSAKHCSMLDVYISVLHHVVVENLYAATVAHLHYSIFQAGKGFIIKVDGFTEKLPVVLMSIIQVISTILSEMTKGIFRMIKEQQLKDYSNYIIKPSGLVRDLRRATLLQQFWTTFDKYNALKEVSFADLQQFSKEILNSLYIKSLAEGNITPENAITAITDAISLLQIKPIPIELRPVMRVVKLPEEEKIICCASLNKNDSNSVLINYYQADQLTLCDYAHLELLMAMMEDPLCDTLRTKEQLGYDVECEMKNLYGILGFCISVYFQADKFEPKYINERIEAFLLNFKNTLKKMRNSEFEDFKQSLIQIKQSPDSELRQGVCRDWSEITSEDYLFNRLNHQVQFLRKATLKSVLKWYHYHTAGSPSFKKISFQVVGNTSSKDKNLVKNNGGNIFGDHLDSHLVCLDQTKPGLYITSIHDFKKNLFVHPVVKTKVM